MGYSVEYSLSPDCLPHPQALSRDQASLIDHLQQISNSSFVDPLFFENLVRALVLFGDCRGLAHICRDGGGTVICRWLRSEITLSSIYAPRGQPIKSQLLGLIDQIDFGVLALREDPRWQILFEAPHPSRNRLIHFQLAISGSPAYQLVAAKLHRGICAKTKQLRHLDISTFNDRLGGFVQPLVRIARNIPADSVRNSLLEYPEGEFDDLVEGVINTLPRNKIGPDGRSTYAPKTLRKYFSGWIAAFYGTASEKTFVKQRHRRRRSSYINPKDSARADELPETHPLREAFLNFANQQDLLEEADRGIMSSRATSSKASRNLWGSGLRKIHKGKAAALFTPSKTITGALSLTTIAILMEGVDRFAEYVSIHECSAARTIIELMLHTGRHSKWLLALQIGNKPNSVWEIPQPRWPIGSRVVCHVPEIYACPPTQVLGESARTLSAKVDNGAAVYERINRIHQVPIPQQIASLLSTFLQTRNLIIDNNPEAAARLKCSHNSGPLFIVEKGQDLVHLSEAWVDHLLEVLTAHLQEFIPDYHHLRVSHFSRSFDGFYASLGLCGVFRYYISGRAGRTYEMPLRYSRVDLKDIDAEYSRAYAGLNEMISAEVQKLFGETRWKLSPEDPVSAIELQQPGEAFFGSTRVPSLAILREIIGSLHADVDQVELRSQNEPRIDALTRLIAVALGLLNGLRPFEVARLTRRNFDLESCAVTVKGKARWGKQVYRRLPLLPGVVNLIEELMTLRGEDLTPGNRIFSLHGKRLRRPSLSTKDLDRILESAAVAAGWTASPVFYGLRHRFRTDMLSSGMDEPNINYLMGHEIIGLEPYSIYSEQRYESLREQFSIATGEMAHRYGFQ